MKRLPPAKRNQLIVVVIATSCLIGLVYFLLIGPQDENNRRLCASIGTETVRLDQIKRAIGQTNATASTLADLNQQLNHAEEDVASGDLYAWS